MGKIYAIEINDRMGVAVGDKGTYVYSEDGGLTWDVSIDKIKSRKWFRDVSLYNKQFGWIVGSTGMVVKTADAGRTWTVVSGKTYKLPVSRKVVKKEK